VKFPVLVSYAYAREDPHTFGLLANSPNVQLLLDCGAFTAKNTGKSILLKDYCRFLDQWGDRLFRYLSLDVVGDPKATEENLREMLRAGYKPVPVHVLGDDQRRMDELFEMSDYVALAGLRRPHKGHCSKEYVAAKTRWARGRDVHWLGYVREEMIATMRPYSCDSASWASSNIWGQMHVYMGKGRWLHSVRYDANPEKFFSNSQAVATVNRMGISTEQMLKRDSWRNCKENGGKSIAQIITADSWVRYVIDILKRYKTRIFLATGMNDADMLLDTINRHADKLHLDPLPV
jgi:hypothetical protein